MDTRSFFADSEIQSDSELSTLIAEILSLESERKDLIGSLTPTISLWVDEISGTATSSVQGKVDSKEPFGILEDIEDLGHRMLSMSHFLSSSNSHIPLYKADELVSTTSKLMKISKDFYESTKQPMEKAMLEAAEEKRKEEKKKRDRMRKKEKEKKKKQQQQKEKDEEEKKKRVMMRKKEKEKKKKKQQQQQQQQKEKDDAQVTSEKITEKMERKEEEEEEEKTRRQQEVRKIMPAHEFLRLSSNVLARPCCYKNELAMMITEEDEQEYERAREVERQAEMEAREAKREAEREAERERERRRERSKQRKAEREAKRKQKPQKKEPIVEEEQRIVEEEQRIVEEEHADEQEAKSPTEQLKERMDNQLGFFAGRRRAWEYSSGSKAGQCGGFEDKTTLSPMQFTHCIPGIIPPRAAVIESTLQIYSFKITGLSDDLKWPLNVYGVVAARDTVDHNRNLLFSRSSIMCQVLTAENDCSLCLTGPSRAILAVDPVDFEVELRIHDGCDYRGDGLNDRELIFVSNRYEVAPSGELPLAPSGELPCLTFHSPLCRAELRLERLPSTVQATILSVRIVGGGSPFKSGGQVACSSSSADASAAIHEKVVLLDSLEGIPQEDDELDLDGYLPLSRNVVSVEFGGGLDVVVKAYGGSGSTSGHVYFPSEYCNTSQRTCLVCGSQVEITVAWSRLVRDKMDLLIDGYTTQA